MYIMLFICYISVLTLNIATIGMYKKCFIILVNQLMYPGIPCFQLFFFSLHYSVSKQNHTESIEKQKKEKKETCYSKGKCIFET